ncbi:MAG: hypothetical protein MUF54_07795 [Polyangiaceae bacterium]|nr:hypothetical protein [Polyangiaceae bacterium]
MTAPCGKQVVQAAPRGLRVLELTPQGFNFRRAPKKLVLGRVQLALEPVKRGFCPALRFDRARVAVLIGDVAWIHPAGVGARLGVGCRLDVLPRSKDMASTLHDDLPHAR